MSKYDSLWSHIQQDGRAQVKLTFDEIAQREVPRHISFEILHLCQAWVREHVGSKLKSLEFLFTCGLF